MVLCGCQGSKGVLAEQRGRLTLCKHLDTTDYSKLQCRNWRQSHNLGTSQQAKGSSGCPEGLVSYPSFSGQV
jgi:hypothetical protein